MGGMCEEAADAEVIRGALDEPAQRTLVQHRSRFVDWLERKTRSRDLAEEILQTAYVRALERGTPEAGDEGLVAWFYTVLRNAWMDRVRRGGVRADAAQRLAREASDSAPEEELRDAICACVRDAVEALKPEYAAVIREVDLGERPLAEVAREARITPNNAGVRLHRARQALGRQLGKLCGACAAHGCLECHCRGT
jgi:RNA polymerase sigma-70 factor (ECF subfamily)